MIQRGVLVDVTLTPKELALEFARMDEEEQSMFFNHIAVLSDKWKSPFDFQMHSVAHHKALTSGGRRVMRTIGEYGDNSGE